MSHPTLTPPKYVLIYVVLLLLTLSTYWIAVHSHLRGGEIPVALGIAGTKTVLVGLFFMHLWWSNRLNWLIVAVGVLFFVILISMTLGDYWTRDWMPTPRTSPPGGVP
jgi:cytochrome c oxidase subunit 4